MYCIDGGHVTVPPEWHVQETTATGYSRVYYIRGGTAWFIAKGEQVALREDTLYLFPSSAPFEICTDLKNPLTCTWLHADFSPLALDHLVALSAAAHPFAARWADSLLTSLSEHLSGEINNLLVEQLAQYCTDKQVLGQAPPRFQPVMDYLERFYGEPITVAQMSGLVMYNPQYFIRAFRAEYGVSPYRYLVLYRLRKAAQFLRQGMTVSEAARRAGYPEVKAFSRAFRKEFGLSPSEYRQAIVHAP